MDLIGSMQGRDCPVCGASASSASLFMRRTLDEARLTSASFASRKVPEFMSYQLVQCRECTTVFASEAPAPDAIAHAYHEADYSTADEASYAADVYRRSLEPFLQGLPHRAIALEIGTGTGIFLRHLVQMGFQQAVGIEPSPAAIADAAVDVRPMIREGVFVGDEFPPGSLSLVCCFQTLEHVPAPREFVEAAFTMLAPGGMIALITHDYAAPINRLLGRRSPIIDIEHLQIFSAPSLRHLVTQAGYDVVAIASFRNTYPLGYWTSLLPVPVSIKGAVLAAMRMTGLGRLPVGMNVGNLLTVAQKPLP